MFSMSTVALAAEPEYKSMMDDAETRQKILASAYADNVAPNYISVDEYLTKYGTTNVIKGFNKAETEHKVNVLKTANEAEKASLMNDVDTLILAVYSGNKLVKFVSDEKDISSDTLFKVNYTLSDTKGVTVKVFFWDSFNGLKPYVSSKTISSAK